MTDKIAIHRFRQDLRLSDNLALTKAANGEYAMGSLGHILKKAGIKLELTYPKDIVDIKQSIESSLIAF